MRKKTEHATGRYAYEGLDRIVHEKARLGIMTSLITRPDGLLFVELKQLCALTDGNLSRHMEVLREAGLVEIWKGYDKKRPQRCIGSPPTDDDGSWSTWLNSSVSFATRVRRGCERPRWCGHPARWDGFLRNPFFWCVTLQYKVHD
jgi:DNA-binding transcriptional ArsR family regulator